jgi:hypothetical protein
VAIQLVEDLAELIRLLRNDAGNTLICTYIAVRSEAVLAKLNRLFET